MAKDKVCKFGGTSMATTSHDDRVIDILMADDSRRFVVVSALGERFKGDSRVTKLLTSAADEYKREGHSKSAEEVMKRYKEVYPDVELISGLARELEEILRDTECINYLDKAKAFGERAMAKVFVAKLKSKGIDAGYLDPKDIGLRVKKGFGDAMPDPECYGEMGKRLKKFTGRLAVTPGFYGYDGDMLWTLGGGSSDTIGSMHARALNAEIYENLSDIDGLTAAHPKIVENPRRISEITYRELRELTYLDFKLQADSFVPLMGTGIPLRVMNTNNPKCEGTLVVENRLAVDGEIVGVAERKGFACVNIYKMGMNSEKGFGKDVFTILDEMNIPYEHSPSGIDDMSVIIEEKYLRAPGTLNEFSRRLTEKRGPADVSLGDSLAFLAVAGEGMRRAPYKASLRAENALERAGIPWGVVDISANYLSFFVGIPPERADDAVRAVYKEFFG